MHTQKFEIDFQRFNYDKNNANNDCSIQLNIDYEK